MNRISGMRRFLIGGDVLPRYWLGVHYITAEGRLGYVTMMGRFSRFRRRPRAAVSGSLRVGVAGCSALVLIGAGAYPGLLQPPSGDSGAARAPSAAATAGPAASYRQIILPDLLVVSPAGLTGGQLASLGKITGVRNLIAFDGAEIKAGSEPVSVIGVDPAQFRSWVPLQTASDQAFWTALAGGEFVAAQAVRSSLGLRPGASYQLTGATRRAVRFGGSAALGIEGVDLLVDSTLSAELGLVHRVAALISAPGASLTTLTGSVRAVLGPSAKIVSLRQQEQQLPVTRPASGQTPTSYLQLFQDSAAEYCPGLSWTVLAAIGQIESGDGANEGPSSAGAMGPMQFLASTWAIWGIDAFGQTGAPDILNPYDAVPSAARMLCADGAAGGGASLRAAIFDYNHADWYVNEVLSLAAEYARDYP
jgi:Transglycosylase SLT domain